MIAHDTNQALGLGSFAVDFLSGNSDPDKTVRERTLLFFTDSVLCGMSALALGTNAPRVLRAEALDYARKDGTPVFGSTVSVSPEKAILANCAAVREWDSNGTNFGYRPEMGHNAGEFGHNDFYPVAIAAAQLAGRSGHDALLGMILLDEIRGRLAEVFSLKSYKIDHVVHGAIASIAVYGAMLGSDPRADRIGDRHVGRPFHPVASDPCRQATQRLQRCIGSDLHRSCDRCHATSHAWI